jgi:hypothetical protein
MVDLAKATRIAAHLFEAHRLKERFQRLRGDLARPSGGSDLNHAGQAWVSACSTAEAGERKLYRGFAVSFATTQGVVRTEAPGWLGCP